MGVPSFAHCYRCGKRYSARCRFRGHTMCLKCVRELKKRDARARQLTIPGILLGLLSCAAPLRGVPAASDITQARCIQLDDRRAAWGAVAKGSAVLAGGESILMLPLNEEKTARTVVASSALVVGALAAAAVFISEDAASSWAKECAK